MQGVFTHEEYPQMRTARTQGAFPHEKYPHMRKTLPITSPFPQCLFLEAHCVKNTLPAINFCNPPLNTLFLLIQFLQLQKPQPPLLNTS